LYEGSVKVTTLVNNKREVIPIGTPQRPFRWHSGPETGMDDTYDWHPTKKRWVHNFDPFSV